MSRFRQILLAAIATSFASGGFALASGGGASGGGSMPSMSAPAYDPAAEYMKGVAALNAQNYKDAERALKNVVEAVPKNAEAWRLLGAANAGQNDQKGARKAYERAVKLEPDNIQGRQGLGVALGALKDPKAQEQLDWLKARGESCGTCADAGTLEAATAAVQSAIGGAPPAAALPSNLATGAGGDAAYLQAVGLINERRYDEALASLGRAREALGPHPDVLTYQGYAWRKKGALDMAESYYRQALAIAPAHRGATEYYGELKVERGDVAGAKAMLTKLDRICAYGCAEAEELRRWIEAGGDPAL